MILCISLVQWKALELWNILCTKSAAYFSKFFFSPLIFITSCNSLCWELQHLVQSSGCSLSLWLLILEYICTTFSLTCTSNSMIWQMFPFTTSYRHQPTKSLKCLKIVVILFAFRLMGVLYYLSLKIEDNLYSIWANMVSNRGTDFI